MPRPLPLTTHRRRQIAALQIHYVASGGVGPRASTAMALGMSERTVTHLHRLIRQHPDELNSSTVTTTADGRVLFSSPLLPLAARDLVEVVETEWTFEMSQGLQLAQSLHSRKAHLANVKNRRSSAARRLKVEIAQSQARLRAWRSGLTTGQPLEAELAAFIDEVLAA